MKDSLPQDAYTELADSYAEKIDIKPHNAFYDRPAIKSLTPTLEKQNILDAACGSGVYTEWLLKNGAQVTGIDANEKMINHAIARNGNMAKFFQANLEEPLSFFDSEIFDGIISPLTITYCRDLNQLFSEFSRILKSKGWFVFSTEHPFFSYKYFNIENYYNTKEISCTWTGFDKPVVMKSFYHSLGTITNALTDNGFVIEKIDESLPTEDFEKSDPIGYKKLLYFPLFIFFRARKMR